MCIFHSHSHHFIWISHLLSLLSSSIFKKANLFKWKIWPTATFTPPGSQTLRFKTNKTLHLKSLMRIMVLHKQKLVQDHLKFLKNPKELKLQDLGLPKTTNQISATKHTLSWPTSQRVGLFWKNSSTTKEKWMHFMILPNVSL